jgi:hypothetical protein
MATRPPRTQTREEQRRLSIRTLVIASVASAAAAVVTSQFWIHGTWISAALTPVIVAIVSEMLHKPTEAVARRVTTDRTRVVIPDEPERSPEPIPDQIKVYGGRGSGGRSRKKFAVGLVAGTAALAFAIGAAALTLPELIAGQSIGGGDRGTTIFGGKKKSKSRSTETQQQTAPDQTEQQTTPTQTQQQTQQQTTPTQTQTQQQTTTQPAPSGQGQQR